MPLKIDLPTEVEHELREAAALNGQAPEEFVRTLLVERFPTRAERARRVAALLEQWDAEDDINPEPGELVIPPRLSLRVPDLD